MKLRFKLALYNTLTKIAIILFTGLITLFFIEKISVNHIEARLEKSKVRLLNDLSTGELNEFLESQTQTRSTYRDFNILNQEYVTAKQVAYQPHISSEIKYRTDRRIVDNVPEVYRVLSTYFDFDNKTYLLEIGESIESVEDLKDIVKKFTLVMLAVALVLTLVSDMVFTKYLLQPFYKIIEKKLVNVNDPLNFDHEPISTTTYDFKMLDDSISTLMKKISTLFQLEKQFIANVSHELLTPISIISTRLENLMVKEELSESAENKIFASLKTLNRLRSIINSLLLISKVENNQFAKTDKIDMPELMAEITEELEDRLEAKNITFYNRITYQFSMTGNRPLLHNMLFNIINNAIKYNHDSGSIVITDDINDEYYTLQIADTGIGMEDPQIEKAFNRFEKLQSDEAESYGLGLAIVKSIATFHQVDVGIKSHKGQGTTFTLIFNKRQNFTKTS
ncbi:sensor histidine kinase [Mucilaginibacter myungsuensis]|uniref:histidine kinase n=1 Tax=Mucilaginibacter myungsuensis TaxID=649104 RepID=A0A929L4C9_9SPHI|nr:HAMP domain-containing sensor histidine kinase [Mucilaginibacter myungsuensis]MBE9664244.1 HAMP domain-containing histidine kinase [Mucilaginibacter myungsuensis]MDN3599948.1 HAMP domain-containing sensor histidine kinase [Mucilaginibacter myungsuensis]